MRHEFTFPFFCVSTSVAMNHEHSDGQSPCESLLSNRPRKALGLSLFFVLGATGGDCWDGNGWHADVLNG